MSELQERPQLKGFYFEMFSSYPFSLYHNRLVVYNYHGTNQEIELRPEQVSHFLTDVIDKPVMLELDGDAEYEGSWLSGDFDEALSKYNAYIEASNVAVRAAAGPAEGGKRHKRKSHKKRKSQKKRRKSHKRGHKKSRRH